VEAELRTVRTRRAGSDEEFPCDPPDSACSPPGRVAAVWPALPGSGFHPMR